jgi:hypothetical protein
MPRRSAADLATPRIEAERRRLDPPEHLTDEERSLFVEIVGSCAPSHFVKSDMPLLASFVQATLLSRSAIKNAPTDSAALATWEKATRMQATLATRLRLAPQARTDPKTIARNQPKHGLRRPWDDLDP